MVLISGTPEVKIVSSLFYDFGKGLRLLFQSRKDNLSSNENHADLSKAFLNDNLDNFLTLFPNLEFQNLPNIRINNMTPKTFLRMHTKNNVKGQGYLIYATWLKDYENDVKRISKVVQRVIGLQS